MAKQLNRLVFVLLALLLALLLLVGFLLYTQSGAKLALKLATTVAPTLQADKVSGRLAGPLQLEGVRFSNEAVNLSLAEAHLAWDLHTLFRGEVVIDALAVRGLRIVSKDASEPEPSSEPFTLPEELPIPLPVHIHLLSLEDAQFQSPGDTSPVILETLQLEAQLSADHVALSDLQLRLQVGEPFVSLSGDWHTRLSDHYKTDGIVNFQVVSADDGDVTGSIEAEGDRRKLNFALRAKAPGTRYGHFELSAPGYLDTNSVALDNWQLSTPDSDARIFVNGTATLDAVVQFDLALGWEALQWPLARAEDSSAYKVRSDEGELTLAGNLEQYDAALRTRIRTPSTPFSEPDSPSGSEQVSPITALATGTQNTLNVHSIDVQAFKGKASGSVSVDWSDAVVSQFRFSGFGFDPGELNAQWPGQLSFEVRGDQAGDKLKVDQLQVDGELRKYPVALNATLERVGAVTKIETLNMSSGDSTLSAQGEIGETLDFSWRIDSSQLRSLYPQLRGSLRSEGVLSGTLPFPQIKAQLNAKNVSYGEYAVRDLGVDADLDLDDRNAQAQSTLAINAVALQVAETAIKEVLLKVSGTVPEHAIELDVRAEEAEFTTRLQGGLSEEIWSGELHQGSLKTVGLPAWELTQSHDLTIDMETQTLRLGCWGSGEAQVCLEGGRNQDLIDARIALQQFPFSQVQALLPEDVALEGLVGGEAKFAQKDAEVWSVDVALNTTASSIAARVQGEDTQSQSLAIEPGSIRVNGDNKNLHAQLDFPFTNGGGLSGDVSARNQEAAFAQAILGGRLQVQFPTLDFLATLSPELQNISGAANFDVTLAGTIEEPAPRGKLTVEEARVELATPGLVLENLRFLANIDSGGDVSLSGGAESGGGTLNWEWRAKLQLAKDSAASFVDDAQLEISGSEFQLWNTDQGRLWASPKLMLKRVGEQLNLDGDILVSRALITPTEISPSAVATTPDQIIIQKGQQDDALKPGASTLGIRSRVKLSLSDDVVVDGFGFKGRLVGGLAIKQDVGRPLLASGELSVKEGEYRAYGQGLVVENGQILFAGGDIENPALNVRALRRPAEGIVVGVNVRGVLKKPELSIFSEPSMSSSNQLSWLVLGRPFETTSDNESDYIAQAALLLGMRGGDYLAKGIGQKLGLDTLTVATGSGEAGAASDASQAMLVVGKYLTPKLYVSYGVGLLDAVSAVTLRYSITDHWNIVTESSALSSSGDINYTIER